MVGTILTNLPKDPIPVPSRCYGLGAHVCVAVVFLVMQWIPIGQIDGNRPGNPGSMMGISRVCPHHLIGVDWAQDQSS